MEQRIFEKFLYLDEQPVNKSLVYSLLRIISYSYNVSIQVAKNHLISLWIIVDAQWHFGSKNNMFSK